MSVNKIILLGRVGKEFEVKHLENGKCIAKFPLATSETYKDKSGERVTNVEWHSIVLWSPLAEIAEKYLKKGDQVFIEGKSITRSYDDKEGQKRYITEVSGRSMTLLGGNKDSSHSAASLAPQTEDSGDGLIQDDLPFILTIPLLLICLQSLPF